MSCFRIWPQVDRRAQSKTGVDNAPQCGRSSMHPWSSRRHRKALRGSGRPATPRDNGKINGRNVGRLFGKRTVFNSFNDMNQNFVSAKNGRHSEVSEACECPRTVYGFHSKIASCLLQYVKSLFKSLTGRSAFHVLLNLLEEIVFATVVYVNTRHISALQEWVQSFVGNGRHAKGRTEKLSWSQ